MEDWGVRPDQVVDFQSLVGDSVDNVPGVPKVGPKTAKTLLETFGTLDHVLANADKAQGKKLQENLIAFADQARMSRELVRLRTDLPLEIDFEAARIQAPDRETLHEFFKLLNFRRFAAAMSDESSAEKPMDVDEIPPGESSVVIPESARAVAGSAGANDSLRPRQQSLFE